MTNTTNITIHQDDHRLSQVKSLEQQKITQRAVKKPFGKIGYALPRLQLIPWKGYPVTLKMLIMYLAAKD